MDRSAGDLRVDNQQIEGYITYTRLNCFFNA